LLERELVRLAVPPAAKEADGEIAYPTERKLEYALRRTSSHCRSSIATTTGPAADRVRSTERHAAATAR
jgi:hypothetical protein